MPRSNWQSTTCQQLCKWIMAVSLVKDVFNVIRSIRMVDCTLWVMCHWWMQHTWSIYSCWCNEQARWLVYRNCNSTSKVNLIPVFTFITCRDRASLEFVLFKRVTTKASTCILDNVSPRWCFPAASFIATIDQLSVTDQIRKFRVSGWFALYVFVLPRIILFFTLPIMWHRKLLEELLNHSFPVTWQSIYMTKWWKSKFSPLETWLLHQQRVNSLFIQFC